MLCCKGVPLSCILTSWISTGTLFGFIKEVDDTYKGTGCQQVSPLNTLCSYDTDDVSKVWIAE